MNKPPYTLPTMAEIRQTPRNGLTVASTFSGCGGSCLGYRMAGFTVRWANEFSPEAGASYRANADVGSQLDTRDIRKVRPEEILEALSMRPGELDVFDGSPPCQAFSMAGQREHGWGKVKEYEHGAKQCNEQLFGEYIRLLRGLQPRAFVAENVSGLVKGAAKGYFLEILAELKAAGYRVACRVLDAQWLGVPQSRARTIFIGMREDLELEPAHPSPLPYRYSLREALPWIRRMTIDPNGQHRVCVNDGSRPSHLITATSAHHTKVEAETDISRFAIGQEWDKLKAGQQSEKYFSLVKPDLDAPSPCIQASHGQPSIAGVVHPTERRKFTIDEVKRICGFPHDFKLVGSYAQQWRQLGNCVPPPMMMQISAAVERILREPSAATRET